jgi:hypothetical protein
MSPPSANSAADVLMHAVADNAAQAEEEDMLPRPYTANREPQLETSTRGKMEIVRPEPSGRGRISQWSELAVRPR